MNVIIPDLYQIISFFINTTKNPEFRDKEFEEQMNEALSSVGLESFMTKISQDLKGNMLKFDILSILILIFGLFFLDNVNEEQRSTFEKSDTPPPSEIFPNTTELSLTLNSAPITTTTSFTTSTTTATITTSTITPAIPSIEDGARHER